MRRFLAAVLCLLAFPVLAQVSPPPYTFPRITNLDKLWAELNQFSLNNGVSVASYGADPTGTNDSSTAFNNAISAATTANGYVSIPCGTYKLNITITNKNNFALIGSPCVTLKPFNVNADVIDVVNGYFDFFKGFQMQGNNASGTGSGMVFSGTFNSFLDNLIIQNFPGWGLQITGTGGGVSGMVLTNSFILYNTLGNLYENDSQDFTVFNNQFGGPIPGGTFAAYGVKLNNSSAGYFIDNKVWNNTIGLEVDNSNYNWINENRLTQSQKQGLVVNGSNHLNIQNNQFYYNSKSGAGNYESAAFLTARHILFQGNNFFDWSGSAHVTYSLTADANSADLNIQNNSWTDGNPNYTIGPTNISPSATGVYMINNTPLQTANVNNLGESSFTMSSGTNSGGVGGAGGTVYLGAAGANTQEFLVYWWVRSTKMICTVVVNASVAPGAGQSETVTVRKNGADTGLTTSFSGTTQGVDYTDLNNCVPVTFGDRVDIKLVGSAGAAASAYTYALGMAQ